MKSPLEINPNKLVIAAFVLALIIVPLFIIAFGIDLGAYSNYGYIVGTALVIFFFLIYPRISKNRQFLEEAKQSKDAAAIIKHQPDVYKLRVAAAVALTAIILVVGYSVLTNNLDISLYVVPLIVFAMMMHRARWMQRHPTLQEYGKKLEQVEVKGLTNAAKGILYGLIIGTILLLLYLFTRLR